MLQQLAFAPTWEIQSCVLHRYAALEPGERTVVGTQPGVWTPTLVLNGALVFQDATGTEGTVVAVGFTWTTPGELVWHAGDRLTGCKEIMAGDPRGVGNKVR